MNKALLSIALAFGLASCQPTAKENTKSKSTTKKTTAFALTNLDTSVAPCDDFYQYAIGGWLKSNPVPSTESRWSSFNVVNDSNNAKLKKILDEYSSSESPKGSMKQQIGDFYLSLMDTATSNKLGIKPIEAQLTKIEALQNTDELISLLGEQKKIGVNSLLSIYVGQDDKNSEQYITHISQSGLGLPDRDYYTNKDQKSIELQKKYQAHIQKMFELLGEDKSEKKATIAYQIEEKLAQVSMTRVDRRIPENTYNKFSFEDLNKAYSQIKWDTYFTSLQSKSFDSLIVGQPDFFKGLNQHIVDIPLEEWKVYLKWRLVDSFANYLSQDFVDQNFSFFSTTLSGTKEMKPLWKRSLRKVNGNIGQLLGKAFVEKHFSEASKKDVAEMVENLRDVFRVRINKLDWMSDETKKKALEKLESFDKKIGYPSKWRDYSKLNIVADNAVQNIMEARTFNFNYMLDKLGKPIDKDEWFMNPQTVNAYYSSSKNEIVFPAGILQPPFYSAEADDALNYGGIGAVIGHEFTHGFDDQGSKYDAHGNLENWWTDEDRKRFEERAQLVVEQFSGFEPLDSLYVNGKLTLGENIADLGGVTLAYHALEKELENKGKPEPIDGFTYQQRFFLGWAQVWHMNMTNEELRKRVATDSHSPGEYRVNGPLANMDEFAKAFQCDSTSTMVNSSSKKAVIW
ncbi:MAG: M13 family metallopeptidase [Vicingaceae bacterium]